MRRDGVISLRVHQCRTGFTVGIISVLIYRWYFRAHGVRGLEWNILGFAGLAPVRETPLGMVETAGGAKGRVGSTRRETVAGASDELGTTRQRSAPDVQQFERASY